MAGYAGQDERCWPSLKEIAKRNGVTGPAIQSQVKKLEIEGYLKREARFNSETGAKKPSVIIFNGDMARQYADCPHIFCQHHVNAIVIYLVTLLRYGGSYLHEILGAEISSGYINKTDSIKQSKETNSNKAQLLLTRRSKVHADAWENEKQIEKETGVTRDMKDNLEQLNNELRRHLNSMQLTEFSVSLQRETKGLSKKASMEYMLKSYEERLRSFQSA